MSEIARALSSLPTIHEQVTGQLTELQREAIRQRIEREKRRKPEERESLVAAATRTCRIYDCGCEDPEDYLTRPLEAAHRCPNPKLRTEVVD